MFFLLVVVFLVPCSGIRVFYASESNIFTVSGNVSYFGYSVQLQRDIASGGRIIVGAPKSENLEGSVYLCYVGTRRCDQIDLSPNEKLQQAGLGSSVDAEETENGFVVTCAPRWGNEQEQSTLGMCYSHKNSLSRELFPLNKTRVTKNYRTSFGQAGFSAHFIQGESHSVVLGSPGYLSWTGTAALYENLNTDAGCVMAEADRPDKLIMENSYFGYAVSSGRFNASNLEQVFYVSGAPRNNELYGSVNIFEFESSGPFKNRYMFRGTQFGEYFGASLAVGDINGDSLDDLIVGAPTYSLPNEDDIGAIYLFQTDKHQTENLKFQHANKLTGEKRRSKFGFAVSYLGDVNNDGYGDVAVGAPYYENTGAVYIYCGSAKGLQENPKQKISASDVDVNLRGFGFSLSRGLDVDDNTNNDFAVGAYLSDRVVLLNSRPLIQIKTNISLDENSQLNINTTDLTVIYCINYKSDVRLNPYNIDLIFTIDINKAVFENRDNHWTKNIQIQGISELCDPIKISIQRQNFRDIHLNLDYNILNTSLPEKFKPIEEHHSPSTLHIPFNKGCSSNICKPNLILEAFFENVEFIIGSSSQLTFNISLENTGENSYTNKLEIRANPEHLKLLAPNFCDQLNHFQIVCNFKYPILEKEKKNIPFTIDVTKLTSTDEKIVINATINDILKTFEIPLRVDANFRIITKSQPEEINNLTGIQTLYHEYTIENVGVTAFNDVKLSVLIPCEAKLAKFLHFFDVAGCATTNTVLDYVSENAQNTGLVSGHVADNALFINCTTLKGYHVKCVKVDCEFENNSRNFHINVTMTFDASLIGEINNDGPVLLSTVLEPHFEFITNHSYIWTKLIKQQNKSASIVLYLAIGILISVVLVGILILVLYKYGFFKKKELPLEYAKAELVTNYECNYKSELHTRQFMIQCTKHEVDVHLHANDSN